MLIAHSLNSLSVSFNVPTVCTSNIRVIVDESVNHVRVVVLGEQVYKKPLIMLACVIAAITNIQIVIVEK